MREIAYHKPRTLEEAFALRAGTPGARWIAGGTDLLVQLRRRRLPPPAALVSLRGVEELRSIDEVTGGARGEGSRGPRGQARGEAGALRIGASVPVADVARHPRVRRDFPALVAAIAVLGSRQIQNVATLGGNLGNASPAADTAPALLVAGARVELRGPGGASRELDLESFLLGPGRTALREDEILAAVILDAPPEGSRETFLRRGRVAMDLAIASAAARVIWREGAVESARIAAGAVAPVPLRLRDAEAAIEGGSLDDTAIDRARRAAQRAAEPITDLRSTAEYRRDLVGVLVARALRRLRGGEEGRRARARGEGGDGEGGR